MGEFTAMRCDIREVGPRDGLQNEAPVPVADRVRLIDALAAAGVRRIEAASFVHPTAIPAMAGAEEVLGAVQRRPGVSYTALVPNRRGAERALAAEADELEAVVSASRTHNLKNLRRTPEETMEEIAGIVELAHAAGRPVDAGVATCFGCPYEGDIDPAWWRATPAACSTSAPTPSTSATPPAWARRGGSACCSMPSKRRGSISISSASTSTTPGGPAWPTPTPPCSGACPASTPRSAGSGGCPYAPGASGNIATEDLVHMVEDLGIDTGISLDGLIAAAHLAEEIVGRRLPGQVMRAGPRSFLVALDPLVPG